MITIETPVGPFSMSGNGFAVTEARFGFPHDLEGEEEERAFTIAQSRRRRDTALPDGEVPAMAVKAVEAYFDGDLHALDSVPVQQRGTPYLAHCWDVLRTLTTPITYTEFAHLTGKPHAVRAAAQGCARNHVALFVPCHRVLRTDGTLGGYRWGLDIKRALLEHERLIVGGTR